MSFSQNVTYKEKLQQQIIRFQSINKLDDFVKCANGFEKIANSEKKDWLAFYYAGLCNVLVAFKKTNSEIDLWCDKAETFARQADSLSKHNSEIMVLKSMISAARIQVNKSQRGQKYGTLASKYAMEAIKLNDANPRAYYVKAQALLYTPPVFGGGEKKAKPVFELVIEKAKTFKLESNIHPNWGKVEAESELKALSSKK